MADKNDDDRRKYVRINRDIPVNIIIPNVGSEDVEAHLASVTRNVSLGGVMIEFSAIRDEMWEKLKEPGLELTLEMFFPVHDERIKVQAVVKWVKEANKLLAQYASIGLSIIEDKEINPNFPRIQKKLQQIVKQ